MGCVERADPSSRERPVSIAAPAPADVLRGMDVESAPLRLARGHLKPAEAAAGSRVAEQAALDEARRRSVEEAVRQGHEEGLRGGHEAGMRKGLADAAAQAQAAAQEAQAKADAELEMQRGKLEAFAGELQAAWPAVLAAAEDEMVALCFETLCTMLGSAAADEHSVRAQLLAVMRRAQPGEVLALHVHPGDLSVLGAAAVGGSTGIPWVGDPEVRSGGCIVRRKGGGLDARLDSMLDACKVALLAARAQRARAAGERA